ncbi:hypothetical protein ILUMI_01144 [Ignelater luminosus]|uniref:Uncharacterized protein n=1 Tax=Ignelater luminosus TaxID=2038154 RepID=A0A8K0DKN3_IGNLU|nr:hypothetical protein ILUMI_01144 [Ignelater luminosus]
MLRACPIDNDPKKLGHQFLLSSISKKTPLFTVPLNDHQLLEKLVTEEDLDQFVKQQHNNTSTSEDLPAAELIKNNVSTSEELPAAEFINNNALTSEDSASTANIEYLYFATLPERYCCLLVLATLAKGKPFKDNKTLEQQEL